MTRSRTRPTMKRVCKSERRSGISDDSDSSEAASSCRSWLSVRDSAESLVWAIGMASPSDRLGCAARVSGRSDWQSQDAPRVHRARNLSLLPFLTGCAAPAGTQTGVSAVAAIGQRFERRVSRFTERRPSAGTGWSTGRYVDGWRRAHLKLPSANRLRATRRRIRSGATRLLQPAPRDTKACRLKFASVSRHRSRGIP